jgi:hypothetical protein
MHVTTVTAASGASAVATEALFVRLQPRSTGATAARARPIVRA